MKIILIYLASMLMFGPIALALNFGFIEGVIQGTGIVLFVIALDILNVKDN